MRGFLLDSHITPRVAQQVTLHHPGCAIESIHTWRYGVLADKSDAMILAAATDAGLTLVTFDIRTVPTLLRVWAANERRHAGVLLVDERTIPQNNVGELMRALVLFWQTYKDIDLTNLVQYLKRAPYH